MSALPLSKTVGYWEQLRQTASTMPAEIGAAVWVLGWAFYLLIGIKRWQASRILLLRTLPISAREINVLLLLRPVVTGLAFWLALLPIYMLAPVGVTAWMGLGSLAGLIGTTSLTSAAMLRWHRSPFAGIASVAVTQLLVFAHPWKYIRPIGWEPRTVQLICLVSGLCGIVAAYAWNERLLTQSGPLSSADEVASCARMWPTWQTHPARGLVNVPKNFAATAGTAPPTCARSPTDRAPRRWATTDPTTPANRSSRSSTPGATSIPATRTSSSG